MSEFTIEIAEISPVERDVKVTVPESFVSEKLSAIFDKLGKDVSIKGFRKGKVPRKVIERMFKKRAMEDLEQDILQEGYQQVIEKHDLHPMALPTVRRHEGYKGEGDYIFSFIIEVQPEIGDIDLDSFSVDRVRLVVKDERIEEELESRRQKAASMKTVEGRDATQAEDWIKTDFESFLDGKPVEGGKVEDQEINLATKQFLPGFEESFVGQKLAEPFEFTLTYPEDFHVEDLKGKAIVFKAVIKEILEQDIPELDDEFAKDLGDYEDLNQLRIAIREELEEQQAKVNERQFHQELWRKVVESNAVQLPPSLLEEQVKATSEQQKQQWAQYGIDPKQMGKSDEDMDEIARKEAEFNLTGMFLEKKLSEKFGVEVSDEEIDARYEDMAAKMNFPVEQLKAYYQSENRADSMKYSIRHDKLITVLADKVNVVEVDPPKAADSPEALEAKKDEGPAADEGKADTDTEKA